MTITFNNIVIQSREFDSYVNATQMCDAVGKKFNNWYNLKSTKELIKALENDLSKSLNAVITAFKNPLVDSKRGRYSEGTWIHPDLAVPLAQWLDAIFAILVSRWVRELTATGSVSINAR